MAAAQAAIGILGHGRFGRALAELCLDADLSVRVYDPGVAVPEALARPSLREVVEGADWVVIAVPVPQIEAALAAIAPFLLPSQLVLDVGSVKSAPEADMKRLLGTRIPWVATHPLFGPTSLALGERPLRVIVCPNPLHPTAALRAADLYHRLGCDVAAQDADTHDRIMADTHALTFFVAKGMMDAKAGEGAAFTPPSFQAIARTIEAVRSDAGHLFLAIQRENPYAGSARRRLLDALSNVDEQLRAMRDIPREAGSAPLAIPDLGASAPDLRATRDLIDVLDRELVDLLARRKELSRRAGRAKARAGKEVRDEARERSMLEDRASWGKERGLDPDCVRDVFESVLRFSRAAQRGGG